MEVFVIGLVVLVVGVALAPMVLMRGQFGKPKGRKGDGGEGGGT